MKNKNLQHSYTRSVFIRTRRVQPPPNSAFPPPTLYFSFFLLYLLSMKLVKNERIIENIDPVNGVTAEQLFEHCTVIIGTIPQTKFLDEDGKSFAINDTVVNMINKINEGVVDGTDYFVFRSYLFITLTRKVFEYNNKKKWQNGKVLKNYLEIEKCEFGYNNKIEEKLYQKQQTEILLKWVAKNKKQYVEFFNYFFKVGGRDFEKIRRDFLKENPNNRAPRSITDFKILFERKNKTVKQKKSS